MLLVGVIRGRLTPDASWPRAVVGLELIED
jgi:hypothetical protein